MATLHLPGDQPNPDAGASPERIPLARLAAKSTGGLSPALTRAMAALHGPGRVPVAAFASSV